MTGRTEERLFILPKHTQPVTWSKTINSISNCFLVKRTLFPLSPGRCLSGILWSRTVATLPPEAEQLEDDFSRVCACLFPDELFIKVRTGALCSEDVSGWIIQGSLPLKSPSWHRQASRVQTQHGTCENIKAPSRESSCQTRNINTEPPAGDSNPSWTFCKKPDEWRGLEHTALGNTQQRDTRTERDWTCSRCLHDSLAKLSKHRRVTRRISRTTRGSELGFCCRFKSNGTQERRERGNQGSSRSWNTDAWYVNLDAMMI